MRYTFFPPIVFPILMGGMERGVKEQLCGAYLSDGIKPWHLIMYSECLSCRHFLLEVSQAQETFSRSKSEGTLTIIAGKTPLGTFQWICLTLWNSSTLSHNHIFLSSAHIAGSPCLSGWSTQSLHGFLWIFVRCSCTWCCLLAYSSHQRGRLFLFLWRGVSVVLSLLVEPHRRDYVGRTTSFQLSDTMSQNLYEALTSASLPDSVFMHNWNKIMES